MTDLNAKAVEAATRARIQAQNPDYPLTDAAWGALRSRVEVEWMRAALAAALPYLAQPNIEDRWWESLVEAQCEVGHRVFIDDGDGGVYECPLCAQPARVVPSVARGETKGGDRA